MAKNKGITNAQNNVFDQNDNAVGGRTHADVFRLGRRSNRLSTLPLAICGLGRATPTLAGTN